MNKLKLTHSQTAFTLIELLVVLVVISILVAITIPVSRYVSKRAADAQYQALLSKITNALEDYRAKYGEYPITPYFTTNSQPTINDYNPANAVLRHYPYVITTECYYAYLANPTSGMPTYYTTFVTYATNLVEQIGPARVDYSLSYPLILAPIARGEKPYLEPTVYTVLYLATEKAVSGTEAYGGDRTRTAYRMAGGRLTKKTYYGRFGWPINRTLVIDPRWNQQVKYLSDGLKYFITTNGF